MALNNFMIAGFIIGMTCVLAQQGGQAPTGTEAPAANLTNTTEAPGNKTEEVPKNYTCTLVGDGTAAALEKYPNISAFITGDIPSYRLVTFENKTQPDYEMVFFQNGTEFQKINVNTFTRLNFNEKLVEMGFKTLLQEQLDAEDAADEDEFDDEDEEEEEEEDEEDEDDEYDGRYGYRDEL